MVDVYGGLEPGEIDGSKINPKNKDIKNKSLKIQKETPQRK